MKDAVVGFNWKITSLCPPEDPVLIFVLIQTREYGARQTENLLSEVGLLKYAVFEQPLPWRLSWKWVNMNSRGVEEDDPVKDMHTRWLSPPPLGWECSSWWYWVPFVFHGLCVDCFGSAGDETNSLCSLIPLLLWSVLSASAPVFLSAPPTHTHTTD